MDAEQRALIQFLGTIHAQAKQTDQQIVNQSQFLKPVSPGLQAKFEDVITNMRAPEPRAPEPPPMPYNQNAYIPATVQQQSEPVQAHIEHKVTGSSDLINVLQDINLNLVRLVDIIENHTNAKPKNKSTKQKGSN